MEEFEHREREVERMGRSLLCVGVALLASLFIQVALSISVPPVRNIYIYCFCSVFFLVKPFLVFYTFSFAFTLSSSFSLFIVVVAR